MGYPMTWRRVMSRNDLWGYYEGRSAREEQPGSLWEPLPGAGEPVPVVDKVTASIVRGDLRRLEHDQRDDRHLSEYARRTGLTPAQCRAVLDAFFTGDF